MKSRILKRVWSMYIYDGMCQTAHVVFYSAIRKYKILSEMYFSLSHKNFNSRKVNEISTIQQFSDKIFGVEGKLEVDTISGISYLDGFLIEESTAWPTQILNYQVVAKPKYCQKLTNEKYALVMPNNGYYHWLIEDLPSFLKVLKVVSKSDIQIVVSGYVPINILFIFDLLTLKYKKVSRYLSSNKLLVSAKSETGHPAKSDVQQVRDLLAEYISSNAPYSKVYISRRESSRTQIWETQLESKLIQNGWKILLAEKMTLTEQVRRISEARILMGIHGAGLANQIFMHPGSTVVELVTEFRSDCFFRLASIGALDFYRVQCARETVPTLERISQMLHSLGEPLL